MTTNPVRLSGTARFVLSAGRFHELPPETGDEFALLGRSNVGKSSFINHACAQGHLAKTSKRPGTTICANLYQLDEALFLVDLPGYGFASAGSNERDRWSKLMSDYCEKRSNLRGILWFVDIRHIGVAQDREAYEWLLSLKKPVLPVLAKADKLSRSGQKKQIGEFGKIFSRLGEPVLFSTLEHVSRERFWERFDAWRNTIK
jgi:GTP-binding protein